MQVKKNSFIQSLHNMHVVFTYWVCKHKHVKVHVKTWKIRNQCIYSTTMSGMVLAYFFYWFTSYALLLGLKTVNPSKRSLEVNSTFLTFKGRMPPVCNRALVNRTTGEYDKDLALKTKQILIRYSNAWFLYYKFDFIMHTPFLGILITAVLYQH